MAHPARTGSHHLNPQLFSDPFQSQLIIYSHPYTNSLVILIDTRQVENLLKILFTLESLFSYDLECPNAFLSEQCGATYNNRSSISHPYGCLA